MTSAWARLSLSHVICYRFAPRATATALFEFLVHIFAVQFQLTVCSKISAVHIATKCGC